MDIGNQISTLRKSHGLSQEQMAAHFHVSRQTVSNWENNRHYPDLATLVRISEDFQISLDQLLKDDRAFVAENDAQRKKGRQQSFLIVLLLLLGLLLGGTIWRITTAFRPTADNQRISTEISLKMWVNLPGQSPSRAITQMFSAESFDTRSDSEQKHLLTAVTGRIEGDIPAISPDAEGQTCITFLFQDRHYQNIVPRIESVAIFPASGLPPEFDQFSACRFDFTAGHLCISTEELLRAVGPLPERSAPLTCAFVIRGDFRGEAFVSITAVRILPECASLPQV